MVSFYYKIDEKGFPVESKVFESIEEAKKEGYDYLAWVEIFQNPRWNFETSEWEESDYKKSDEYLYQKMEKLEKSNQAILKRLDKLESSKNEVTI